MKKLLVLILCLTFAGCVSLSSRSQSAASFQQALKQQDFRRAESIATQLDASHTDYPEIKKQLPALRRAEQQFMADALARARALTDKQQFKAARELLENARERLPAPASELADARKETDRQEQQWVNLRLADLRTSEAEWLLGQQTTLSFLTQQQQDRTARRAATALDRRRQTLAHELASLGETFADQEDWSSSQRCLLLAARLDEKSAPAELLKSVQARLEAVRTRKVQQKNSQLQDDANGLITRYHESRKISDLLAANRFVNTRNRNGELMEQAQTLETLTRERIEHDMQQGDAFYANGRYTDASRIWHALRPIAPGNDELKKKLERVSRVLNSLDTLKQQGTKK